MNDVLTVTEYRDIVFELSTIRQQMEWNARHNLPVLSLAGRADRLRNELIRFEAIMDRIQDRQIRNVIMIRYALGMTVADTAAIMSTSRASVLRLQERGMDMIRTGTAADHRGCKPLSNHADAIVV